MSKKPDTKPEAEQQERTENPAEKPKRTKTFTFPDIDGSGLPVAVEATSIEEATALFRKGRVTNS